MSGAPLKLKDCLVRAGAGAGKTRGLVDKVVEVYRASGGEARIVLTTFTRKATQELKERLILRACSEKDAALLQFVSDPGKLQISTIHGLLNIFLKQVGHLAGLDSGFQIISEVEGEHLAKLALREVLVKDNSSHRWLEIYGFERTLKMCRIFAQAGREQGEMQPATLADLRALLDGQVSYWKRTLSHLLDEVRANTGDAAWLNYASELQSFHLSWKGVHGQLTGLPSKPRRSKKQVELEFLHETAESTIGLFKKEMGKDCWDQGLWPKMIQEWIDFEPLAKAFSENLERLKEAQARYEMVDLELKSLEIVRAQPFLGIVFSQSWDFWMIDEYQDTSPLQVAVLDALIADRPRYLVGDPQQSIYLFRGAEVQVFHDAEVAIQKSGGQLVELKRNYRSEPSLLAWINDFMATLGPAFMRMEPRAEDYSIESAPNVTLWRALDLQAELKGLASQIQKLLAQGARLEEICILGRTHRNLMDVSRSLKEWGFPTHVHSSRGFGNRREVLDAQALWKFLINPHDNLNLLILLRSPWFFVEDWQLSEWMKERPHSLWRKLLCQTAADSLPDALQRLRATLEPLQTQGVVRAFEQAMVEQGLLDLSLTNDPAGRKESNLWKLIVKARELEKEGTQTLLDLMQPDSEEALEANEGDATSAQEPNCINLMTIHGSKGLEFEHVFLPCMGEAPRTSITQPLHAHAGLFYFPIWNEASNEFVASPLDVKAVSHQRERELEEYDRWLYVALTRAKKTLTLSWSSMARESWAERSIWFSKVEGAIVTDKYRVDVVEQMPEATPYTGARKKSEGVRTAFQALQSDVSERRRSVTELVADKSSRRLNVSELIKRWQSQTLGTGIHRALEALRYNQDYNATQEEAEAIEYVLGLETPPLQEVLQSGYAEWGFQVQAAQTVVEGQIDLWGKVKGIIYLVDYKSGSTAQKDTAFEQLSLYAWALRCFGHTEPIRLVVLYPLKRECAIRDFEQSLFMRWEDELGRA